MQQPHASQQAGSGFDKYLKGGLGGLAAGAIAAYGASKLRYPGVKTKRLLNLLNKNLISVLSWTKLWRFVFARRHAWAFGYGKKSEKNAQKAWTRNGNGNGNSNGHGDGRWNALWRTWFSTQIQAQAEIQEGPLETFQQQFQ